MILLQRLGSVELRILRASPLSGNSPLTLLSRGVGRCVGNGRSASTEREREREREVEMCVFAAHSQQGAQCPLDL